MFLFQLKKRLLAKQRRNPTQQLQRWKTFKSAGTATCAWPKLLSVPVYEADYEKTHNPKFKKNNNDQSYRKPVWCDHKHHLFITVDAHMYTYTK